MRMNLDTWLAAILFLPSLGETFFASSIIAYWPLVVQVCLQQRYARSVKLQTCKTEDM